MDRFEKKFPIVIAVFTRIMPVSQNLMFFTQFVKGKLYITGGVYDGDWSTQADVVDVRKGGRNVEMTELSPMRYPRTVHATATTGHYLFVFGGYARYYIKTCEVFNTSTNT